MGRKPCCDKVGLKKGPWTAEEDSKLINFILITHHQYCWRAVPKLAGLLRCGKSCRLRWINYLRPDLKRGILSEYEENMVIHLHSKLGNRWSKIASHFPGRTDNEIKNFWNTYIKKKLKKMGIDPQTHKPDLDQEGLLHSSHDDHHTKQQQQEETHHLDDEDDDDHHHQLDGVDDDKKLLLGDESTTSDDMILHDEFCIDEVPLIQPHDILINHLSPNSSTTITTSSSSSSSSSSTSSSYNNNNNNNNNPNLTSYDWDNFWDVEDYHFSTLDLFFHNNF